MKKVTHDEIESLLENLGEIPTLPSIATTIMERTLDARVNARQIAQMVERDQALAVKVLKVANSPFYRRIKEISTIRGAVVLLGFNVLKSIVLSISVINLFNEKEKRNLDFYKFWQHSIACAVCAKSIASKISPPAAEDAFIAGLLHDLGKVVADQLICKNGEYREVLEVMNRANSDIIEVERSIVGVDHATLGKYLMEKWNLPALLCKTVGYHHTIVEAGDDEETRKLCAIVHVADIVTNHLGLGLGQTDRGFVDPTVLSGLGLSSHDIQEISLTLKDSISSISDEMGIPRAEPKTYFEVLQFANAQLGKLSLDLEQKKMALERRTVELSSLNQMSSQLQSSMKLSDIITILTSNALTILEAKKTRCIMRLSNLRIMITESFWLNNAPHTRSGMASTTKELLDRSNAVYPKAVNFIYAPLKVDNTVIGVLEAMPQEGAGQEEINQRLLLLRTVAEVGAQAIQRAMLITKSIKAQRLAAVSKTAIAANHEINTPLTTILLKLDMLVKEANPNKSVMAHLQEIKTEAIKIKNIVKKMLEISDVVETSYVKNEKMLDLHHAPEAEKPDTQEHVKTTPQIAAGFEDYTEEARRQAPSPSGRTAFSAEDATPGFEDYMEQQTTELSGKISPVSGKPLKSDTPGFEDYLE
ncbi:MAG: HDOD domain-containing protein [Pseudomonadota bacterium]|nr:HDOD domain-containing protein [Pseudomonadota bacterium]